MAFRNGQQDQAEKFRGWEPTGTGAVKSPPIEAVSIWMIQDVRGALNPGQAFHLDCKPQSEVAGAVVEPEFGWPVQVRANIGLRACAATAVHQPALEVDAFRRGRP